MAQGGSNKKTANTLVAMSSAAVLAVYAAGYTRTRSAAQQLDAQSEGRRPASPAPSRTAPLIADVRPVLSDAPVSPASPAAPVPSATLPAPAKPAPEIAAVPATNVPSATPAESQPPAATAATKSPEPAAPPVEKKPEAAPVPVPVAPPAAPVPPAPPVPAPVPAAPVYKDGTYLGWGTSRHGDIQASVVIEGGRIAGATIAQCWTRYSCNVIAHLPPQVAQRQSPDVDFVSGATQSANAFYYGVVDALSKAK